MSSMAGIHRKLEGELSRTRQALERQAQELRDFHEDHTEAETLRQQLAGALVELNEKSEVIYSLSQTVHQLQGKIESLEATLRDETHFKMELMRELSKSKRELEALYSKMM